MHPKSYEKRRQTRTFTTQREYTCVYDERTQYEDDRADVTSLHGNSRRRRSPRDFLQQMVDTQPDSNKPVWYYDATSTGITASKRCYGPPVNERLQFSAAHSAMIKKTGQMCRWWRLPTTICDGPHTSVVLLHGSTSAGLAKSCECDALEKFPILLC